MKVRSLKQVFHWVFLIVGIFSLIMMGITVNTYLGYAEEGYGLRMSFDQASLNNNWLVLRLHFDNPGKLDIDISGGNLTLSRLYEIPHTILPNGLAQDSPISSLPGGENTSVVIWIPISDPDLTSIQTNHQSHIFLDLELWVPERFMNTHITFEGTVGVSV